MYRIYVDNQLFCDSRIDDLVIINPKITLEANKAGSMTFTIPPVHPYYDLIQRKTSIIDVYRDDEEEPIFEGIASSVTDDFYQQRQVECEGELAFLNDTIQRPARYQGLTSRQLLETYINIHNSLCEENKRFAVGQVTVNDDYMYRYTNYDTTMASIKEDLVDDLGGYLHVRHVDGVRYLDYLADAPHTASQTIELGENLLDFETNLDSTEIATVIIPLGATIDEDARTSEAVEGLDEKLNIKSVNDGKDYLYSEEAVKNFGWIEQVIEWSDVTTASALKSKGQAYLQDVQFENMTITANALDLHLADSETESFKMLDKIRVVSKPHGLDRYFLLGKQTINLNNPENDEITLGTEESVTMTAKSQSSNSDILKRIEQVPTSTQLQSAIKNATALITGAEGGYVVISTNDKGEPQEILVMDSDDKETASRMWRWNINGLGYSNDGGQTYGLAMTMDGAIVADYITTGKLSTDRLSGQITADSDVTITWAKVTDQPTIPSKTSDLTNNSGFINSDTATQITKNTVTTTYVNALGITASHVACENLTGSTISGKTISGGTVTGTNVIVGSGQLTVEDVTAKNANGVTFNGAPIIAQKSAIIYNGITIYSGISMSGDIVPITSGRVDCGTSSRRIGTLYVCNQPDVSSDRRLKDDIADISDDVMEAYYELQPRQFTTKDDESKRIKYGFIAQEVQEDLKKHDLEGLDLLYEGSEEEGDYMSIRYGYFTALNTRAILDLKKEVESLKEEIATLKGESNE